MLIRRYSTDFGDTAGEIFAPEYSNFFALIACKRCVRRPASPVSDASVLYLRQGFLLFLSFPFLLRFVYGPPSLFRGDTMGRYLRLRTALAVTYSSVSAAYGGRYAKHSSLIRPC